MVKLTQTKGPGKTDKQSPKLNKATSAVRTTRNSAITKSETATKGSVSARSNKSQSPTKASTRSTVSKININKSARASRSTGKAEESIETESEGSVEIKSKTKSRQKKNSSRSKSVIKGREVSSNSSIEVESDDGKSSARSERSNSKRSGSAVRNTRGNRKVNSLAIRPTRSLNREIDATTKRSTSKRKSLLRKRSKKSDPIILKERLRPRKEMNFAWRTDEGYADDDYDDEGEDFSLGYQKKRKRVKGEASERVRVRAVRPAESFEDIYEDENDAHKLEEVLDKIPKNKAQLRVLHDKVQKSLKLYKEKFITEQKELESKVSLTPVNSVPICADVRTFDFLKLAEVQKKVTGRLFDVIMMDPPWQLSTSTPSRGVAIGYDSLSDDFIKKLPIPKLSDNGFIFVWTINAKFSIAIKLIEHWGYKLVDEVTWVKKTGLGKIAKSHGFYLQHAKESCLVGVKGKVTNNFSLNTEKDVIFSLRRGQSQKPDEMYELIERLAPNGHYLEIFGRRNNLRNNWVTVGNEL